MLRRLWHARRTSVELTARGWQAVFFGALSFLAAWLIGTTQIYQLAYALSGLLLVALVLGFVFSRGLKYARRVPPGERFVAGHPSQVELAVSNASRRRSPAIEVVDHLPKRRLLERPPVKGARTQATWEPVLFAKRGLYKLGPAQIRTVDPLGLVRFVRKFETPTEVMVYPKVFELEGFPVRGRSTETGTRGAFVRRGDEFSDLREYRHGDDRRHIHWKSVARTGELIVKEFAHNAPQRRAIVLDLHRRAGIQVPEAEVEDAVSAAGSVLRYLSREGLPFRLLCADKGRSATGFGDDEAAYWRAMDLLATAQADGNVGPGDFLAEKLREGREGLGEGVVLILRSLGDDLVRSVRRLRAAGFSVVVVALATPTYRAGDAPSGREAAFSEGVRRLGLAGADVRVVRRPGGMAAFAGQRRAVSAADGRRAV
jgi:uncharacterized protein (DUF58 family)